MKLKDIKPIPKNIEKRIRAFDKEHCPEQKGLRFYAYLTTIRKELFKVTVAMRNKSKQEQLLKQVAYHGVHSDTCLVKDLEYCYLGICAYRVGWYDEGIKYRYGLRPNYNNGIWYIVKDKYYDPYAPVINPEYALQFPEYKYSVADKYGLTNIIKYLRIYEQYPQAEYLIKLGLQHYATSKMLLALLAKNKAFRRWIITNKDELAAHKYFIHTVLFAYKHNKPLATAQRFISRKKYFEHEKDYKPMRELFRGKLLERFFNYIDSQDTSYQNYLDYLKACNYLRLDMTVDKNRFPHDFKRWHDIRIDEYATQKAIADEKQRTELYKSFAFVSEKYLSLQNYKNAGYIVFIARSPAELIREGDFLHHCVGRMNYDQKFVREESLIFFIRNIAEPETPFVTMEYSLTKRKVLQCYASHNSRPSETVLDFVNKKWLPFANRQIKKLLAA